MVVSTSKSVLGRMRPRCTSSMMTRRMRSPAAVMVPRDVTMSSFFTRPDAVRPLTRISSTSPTRSAETPSAAGMVWRTMSPSCRPENE